jgi:transposase-like protein
MRYPHCQSEGEQVKAGFNASGSQRNKCNKRQKRYTPEPNEIGYAEEVRRKALELYVDGVKFPAHRADIGVGAKNLIREKIGAHMQLLVE